MSEKEGLALSGSSSAALKCICHCGEFVEVLCVGEELAEPDGEAGAGEAGDGGAAGFG